MKYIFTATIILLSNFMYAQPGTLDSTFGTDGKVIFSPDYGIDCFGIAKQSDEKIICVSSGITVSRFTNDGSIDTTFGINGLTLIDNPEYSFLIGYAVAIQADNKVIVAGYGIKGQFEETNYDMIIARLTADGKIDSSFGTNGIAIADYGKGDVAYDLAIQPDGKIIVQGSSSGYFNTLRYLPDGKLDTSFGEQGHVITQFSGMATGDAVVLQPDGKIIAAGHDLDKILLVRYMPNGNIDETFGDQGTVRSDLTNYSDNALDIVMQPDGKIIVGGYITAIIKGSSFLARYNSDGNFDSSFGNNGFTIYTVGYASDVKSIKLQNDGKIVTAGGSNETISSSGHFTMSRFTKDGNLDSSFGTNGNTVTAMSSGDDAYGIMLQNDNKIVLGGTATNGLYGQLALARYNNDLTKKQIIITKIRRWIQHHNGIMWDNISNVKNYAIQRSGDGAYWSTVYKTKANSQQLTANGYNDPSPLPGANYYRLQTTSIDGAVSYSNVIAITNNDAIKISPNPAKNILHIEGLSSKARITVISFNGFAAISQQLKANSYYNLNIASLKPGNYLLKIEMNGEVVTKKFVKE